MNNRSFSYYSLALVLGVFLFSCRSQKERNYSYLLSEKWMDHPVEKSHTDSGKDLPKIEEGPDSGSLIEEVAEDNKKGGEAWEGKMDEQTRKILTTAQSYMGTPYQYGGLTRKGIDCSGLVWQCYRAAEIALPRASYRQAEMGTKVAIRQIRPGDLVFFSTGGSQRINHVGIVWEVEDGDVSFIHASTSKGVRIDQLSQDYWSKRFKKGVRL